MEITLSTGRKLGADHPCFVVAEIGQNHNGDVYTAVRLLKAAHDAGVDAAKLCKRHIPSDLTAAARRQPYCGPQSFGPTYGEHREKLELTRRDYAHLKDRMRYNQWPEILFATVCDIPSLEDVEVALDPPLYKIASRDLDNLPLLCAVADTHKPVVLSTGMARDESEIGAALEVITRRHDKIVLMVCTSEYPTPNDHVHLWRLHWFRRFFGCLVGLSDHTPGIVAAQAAATLGACMIEKHLTLSRAMKGTDHAASLEPDGMARLVRNIREVEQMRGLPQPLSGLHDGQARKKLGRSLVTAREIPAGKRIELADLCLKSPGDGLPWASVTSVIGATTRRALPADVTIQASDLLTATVPALDGG